ncbi:hypothetical protein [Clostridium sp.]|uniref:hypothetical protein n=1 Tax=Clostridium sp. TaxID=1506 RepID=UPI0026016236|nr:hypothetical protein [Clostridium sp.]
MECERIELNTEPELKLELYPIHKRKTIIIFGKMYCIRPKALKVYQNIAMLLGILGVACTIAFARLILLWVVFHI